MWILKGFSVLICLFTQRRSFQSPDQKMAGFLLKTKMDTSLESVFRDLHDRTTLVTLVSKTAKLIFSVTSVRVLNLIWQLVNVTTWIHRSNPPCYIYTPTLSKTRTRQTWPSQLFSSTTVTGPFLWHLSHSKQHRYIIRIPFLGVTVSNYKKYFKKHTFPPSPTPTNSLKVSGNHDPVATLFTLASLGLK